MRDIRAETGLSEEDQEEALERIPAEITARQEEQKQEGYERAEEGPKLDELPFYFSAARSAGDAIPCADWRGPIRAKTEGRRGLLPGAQEIACSMAEGLGIDPNRVKAIKFEIDANDTIAVVEVDLLPIGTTPEQWRDWMEALPVALVVRETRAEMAARATLSVEVEADPYERDLLIRAADACDFRAEAVYLHGTLDHGKIRQAREDAMALRAMAATVGRRSLDTKPLPPIGFKDGDEVEHLHPWEEWSPCGTHTIGPDSEQVVRSTMEAERAAQEMPSGCISGWLRWAEGILKSKLRTGLLAVMAMSVGCAIASFAWGSGGVAAIWIFAGSLSAAVYALCSLGGVWRDQDEWVMVARIPTPEGVMTTEEPLTQAQVDELKRALMDAGRGNARTKFVGLLGAEQDGEDGENEPVGVIESKRACDNE
jgi:hypothetical protein